MTTMTTSPLAYSISEAGRMLSLSRSMVYALISTGRLTAAKIGNRTVVPHDELVKLVAAGRGQPLGKGVTKAAA